MAIRKTWSVSLNHLHITLLALVAVMLLSLSASATPIILNNGISPQPANAGDGTIQKWLINAIHTYNTTHDTSLSTTPAGAHPDIKVDSGDTVPAGYPAFGAGVLSITLPGNHNDYLVLHWGGKGGGVYQAFDLSTSADTSDVYLAPGKNGLSFYAFYGKVDPAPATPEPGTMVLLGSGMLGVAGILRRKWMV